MEDATIALAYVVMALGLNIVVGFAGLLDLGYVAFYAIGAYTIGWFALELLHGAGHPHRGVRHSEPARHPHQLPAHPRRRAPRGAAGAILGFPTLRLRGDYIAIVTLAFGEIIGRFALNSDEIMFGNHDFNLTNGRHGLTPMDQIDIPLVDPFTTLNLQAVVLDPSGLACRPCRELPPARLAHRAAPGSRSARTRSGPRSAWEFPPSG